MKQLSFLFLLIYTQAYSQTDSIALEEIKKFQVELNKEYTTPESSPLEPHDLKNFKSHDFFEINLKFRVTAILTKEVGEFFEMKTSTAKTKLYRQYGKLSFTIDGRQLILPVYQSKDLMNTEKYADYLFFPFTDVTNGETSYAAGRYISLYLPKEGNEMILDFNQAYNPYCAYSKKFSCPVVPRENDLAIKIEAGVRYKY
jgi:uncharacterized protein (DUF1684 family)